MAALGDLKFRVATFTPAGERVYVEDLVESLYLEEISGELAQRLTLSIKNERFGKKRVASLLANGAELRYYAGTDKLEERFRGRIFHNSSAWHSGPRHDATAYDPLYYLTNSEDDRYVKEGLTGANVIADIARAWGIPVGKLAGPNQPLAKKAFRGRYLSDQIAAVLSETRRKGGGRWLVRMERGKLETVRRASNKKPFVFEAEDIGGLAIDRSIEQLVTVAEVVGRDKTGSKTLARAEGLTEFGTLQRIINRADYNTPKGAKRAALQTIKDEGREIRVRSFTAIDIPSMRRGDAAIVKAGTLSGSYIVESITHDPMLGQMFLDVIDPDELEIEVDWEATEAFWSWEPPEDRDKDPKKRGKDRGQASAGGWMWPVNGPLNYGFGPRVDPFTGKPGSMHYGIDIGAPQGTPIYPGKPGRVSVAGWVDGYGNAVYLTHEGGYESRYAHMVASPSVSVGESVGYADKLGDVGSTGNSTGPHLHLEIRRDGEALDPESFLP